MTKITMLDHTADTGIRITATTRQDIFTGAARALFSLILDPTVYKPTENTMDVRVQAESPEHLLREWLSELLYFHAVRKMIFTSFKIWSISDTDLEAIAEGYQLGEEEYHLAVEIKAVTYHGLYLQQTETGYEAQVIFDT